MLRELIGTIQSQDAVFGVLVTVHAPPKSWYGIAKKEGIIQDGMVEYPRVQIYTVQDMLNGKTPMLPAIQHQIPRGPRARPSRGLQKRL